MEVIFVGGENRVMLVQEPGTKEFALVDDFNGEDWDVWQVWKNRPTENEITISLRSYLNHRKEYLKNHRMIFLKSLIKKLLK
jgi:hypothetical protein